MPPPNPRVIVPCAKKVSYKINMTKYMVMLKINDHEKSKTSVHCSQSFADKAQSSVLRQLKYLPGCGNPRCCSA